MTIVMATKSGLPGKTMARGGILLVRKRTLRCNDAKRARGKAGRAAVMGITDIRANRLTGIRTRILDIKPVFVLESMAQFLKLKPDMRV